jgi:hypothetical protein
MFLLMVNNYGEGSNADQKRSPRGGAVGGVAGRQIINLSS